MANTTLRIARITGVGVLSAANAEFGYVVAASPEGDVEVQVPAATVRQVAAMFDILASVLEQERKRLGLATNDSGMHKVVKALELSKDLLNQTVTLRTRYHDDTACDTPLDREKMNAVIGFLTQAGAEFDAFASSSTH